MSQRGARAKPGEASARPRERQAAASPNPRSRDHGDTEFRFHRDGIRAGLAEIAERLGARPPPEEAADPAGPVADLEKFEIRSADAAAPAEEPETGFLAEPETDLVEPETDLAEPETDLVEPETPLVESETDLVEAETGLAEEPEALSQPFEPDDADMPAEPANEAQSPEVCAAPAESAVETEDSAEPATRPEELRLLEALLFAAAEPVEEKVLAKRLPPDTDVHAMLKRLALEYAPRGINLVRVGRAWAFRTANDLAWLLTHEAVEPKKLSRAAIETLAIIAYHQPVTRAEIEDIRGVAAAKGTLDVLLETGWIRPRGRRKAPGRPLTFGTTEAFLSHFGLEQLTDLPGLDELKGAGLFDGQLPAGFNVPAPSDDPTLREDEDPLEPADLDLGLAPRLEPEVEG